MQVNANLFAAADTRWDSAYGCAVRAISIAVRKHLTYGFFTWQPVRSMLRVDDGAEVES